MNERQLQEIKKRVDRATAGPWFCSWSTFEEFAKVNIEGFCITDELNDFDAEFIAHAREDVPALIAEVEKQRKQASFYYEQFINSSEVIQDLTEKLDQVERAEEKRRQVMLGWRRSWKRKRKEAKVLAKACRKHIEHVAKVEQENERLREALKQILEDEAPNCDGYETFIHATARQALEGESNAI